MIRYIIIFLCSALLFGQTKLPNDIRWVRESQEYAALCRQTYQMAWESLKSDLRSSTIPTAIVMDLDETVLDNSQYEVENFIKNEHFTMETWADWVNRAEAGVVPGAKAFIDSVRTLKNIRLIFISNRMAVRTGVTIENMKVLELFDPADIYLLARDSADKKPVRREEVFTGTGRMKDAGAFIVAAWFGDAIGDFPAEKNDPDFGHSWFVISNPMYGKW